MKKVWRLLSLVVLPGWLLWIGAGSLVHAADLAQERIEALAKALAAAPSDDERHHLLDSAPPELARDEQLRRQFHVLTKALIYNGEYDRARGLLSFARQWCEQSADREGVVLAEMGEGNIHAYQGHNREAL
ncbi:MAG: hypothetical protein INR62_04570, partial [Rhodospirillales bacterium]|nr:hypothetical protein [Acetobacter sp.]